MSSRDIALRITGLSKSYKIRHQHEQHITLAEQALSRLRHPFRRAEQETFWALKDINLEVKKGEVLGIIGRNGAGKSTLLKVLSRITAPTAGRVEMYGRLGSLLEVGTGFHPELTGRENVYLNGTILGMKKGEIDRRFDEIVEFAGVEKFLDTPVKRYSSGMYVRLAFAVAAHLETEILLIDEVLAVGDAEFQRRCIGKMRDVRDQGRTVLLVSHQMAIVQALATRALFLDHGRVGAFGEPAEIVELYGKPIDRPREAYVEDLPRDPSKMTGDVILSRIAVVDDRSGWCTLNLEILNRKLKEPLSFLIVLHTSDGSPLCFSKTDHIIFPTEPNSRSTFSLQLPTQGVRPGEYGVTVAAVTFLERAGHISHDYLVEPISIDVDPISIEDDCRPPHWPPSWGSVALSKTLIVSGTSEHLIDESD